MELRDYKVRLWAKKNLTTKANKNYVICEVLRLIYDELDAYQNDERRKRINEYLIDCIIMSRKMADRLHYYQRTYKDTTGKNGFGIPEFGSRLVRRMMRKMREL